MSYDNVIENVADHEYLLLPAISAVDSDTKGIKPSSLKEVLENWPESRPKPKILYTVPVS